MTASPALLTNERLDRIRADHADNRTYAHYGQRDIGALLQHIAALEQRVADLRNRLNLSEKLQGRFPVDAVQPDTKEPR